MTHNPIANTSLPGGTLAATIFIPIIVWGAAWFGLHTALVRFPFWAQVVVLCCCALLLLFWAFAISGVRGSRFVADLYKQGFKYPFFFSVALLLFAQLTFAYASAVLSTVGLVELDPTPKSGSLDALQSFYLWHFLNAVPTFKIPETLLWEIPFVYKDGVSGALMLAFKVIVVFPVIASINTWWKVRKEENNSPLPHET